MRPHLRSLKKGQEVWAIVDEILARDEVIINFSGDLIRVQNKTEKNFRVGMRVLLQVHGVAPLKLKLVTRYPSQRSPQNIIDLSI